MKITDVKVIPVNSFLYVKVFTDEGPVGLGESGATPCPMSASAYAFAAASPARARSPRLREDGSIVDQ